MILCETCAKNYKKRQQISLDELQSALGDCLACKRNASKLYTPVAEGTEQQVQPDNSPKMCEECGEYPADLPSNLCCGCDAYKEHLS